MQGAVHVNAIVIRSNWPVVLSAYFYIYLFESDDNVQDRKTKSNSGSA